MSFSIDLASLSSSYEAWHSLEEWPDARHAVMRSDGKSVFCQHDRPVERPADADVGAVDPVVLREGREQRVGVADELGRAAGTHGSNLQLAPSTPDGSPQETLSEHVVHRSASMVCRRSGGADRVNA
jgi:hypothetical protein